MKNIEDAQITAAATKPSFSDVSHQVKSNISTRRKSMEVYFKAYIFLGGWGGGGGGACDDMYEYNNHS